LMRGLSAALPNGNCHRPVMRSSLRHVSGESGCIWVASTHGGAWRPPPLRGVIAWMGQRPYMLPTKTCQGSFLGWMPSETPHQWLYIRPEPQAVNC